jgi:hypothetical protein
VYQRYARPWTHGHEPNIYVFGRWRHTMEDGSALETVRVTRRPNPLPVAPAVATGPTTVDPHLLELAQEAAATGQTHVFAMLKLRGFPRWDVPLIPPAGLLSAAEHDAAIAERQSAEKAREELFALQSRALRERLVALGADLSQSLWRVGWLGAWIPPSAITELAEPSVAHAGGCGG